MFKRVLALTAVIHIALFAQQNVGSIKGTIKDATGGSVAGASIVAQHEATGVDIRKISNEAGVYAFPNLEIGEYTLIVTAPGFKTSSTSHVRVISGVSLTLDFDLPLGEVTEKVEVSAQSATVDTTTSTMGTTRTSEEIHNMPLQLSGSARSSLNFLRTLSILTYDPQDQDSSIYNRASFSGSNGFASTNYTSYSIDGVTASSIMFVGVQEYSPLAPDLVAEVRLASNFDAEKGWNSGAGIELVTKSGTNQFHGSLFEYLRNTKLDARNFFAAAVTPTRQNEFGLLFAGPVRKNKTFFLGSYDGFRFRTTPAGSVASVPTELMRGGNFSQLSVAIYDPLSTRSNGSGGFTRDPFPGNTIPSNRISPVSLAFQRGYPIPNLSGTQLNWVGSIAFSPYNIDKIAIKIDHQFNDNHRLSIGYDQSLRDDRINGALFGPEIAGTNENDQHQYRPRINYTWVVRPNLIYNFRAGFTYEDRVLGTYSQKSSTYGGVAGLKGTVTHNTPSVSIQGMSGFGYPFLKLHDPHIPMPVSSNLTWTKGTHNFRIGADFLQAVGPFYNSQNSNGSFSFTNRITGLPNVAGSGFGYASFLLGEVDNATMNSVLTERLYNRGWAFFAQDQWRLTSKWTINYGLRWDFAQPSGETHDRFGAFNPGTPNPAAGGRLGALMFWGDGPGRNGLRHIINPNYRMLDPRIGLAYAPNAATVIRAYYGLIHSSLFSVLNDGTTATTYGWTATIAPTTVDNGLTPAFNWNDGYPAVPALPTRDPSFLNGSSVNQIDPSVNKTDLTQAIGFSVERSLKWNFLVRGEYIGKLTHGLNRNSTSFPVPVDQLDPKYFSLGNLLLNNIYSPQAAAAGISAPYPGFQGSVAQALLPYPQYTSVFQFNNRGGFTEYHGGHFALQKRVSAGLSFLVDYTFSKMLVSRAFQHLALQNTQKGMAMTDRPQSLSVSYNYELPFGRGKAFLGNAGGLLQMVVGGWEAAGFHNYFSGQPVSVSSQATIPGVGAVWANRVSDVPVSTGIGCPGYQPGNPSSRYLNINAFATPAPYTFGNVAVLPHIRGCGYAVENVSIIKKIQLTEQVRLQFAGNFFNLLNRHYWTGLSTDINNLATFGRFSGATPPRSIQLNAKIEF